jgi:hypothetical protein
MVVITNLFSTIKKTQFIYLALDAKFFNATAVISMYSIGLLPCLHRNKNYNSQLIVLIFFNFNGWFTV